MMQEELRRLVAELWLCLDQSADYHAQCTRVSETIRQASRIVGLLSRRLDGRRRRYVVALVGSTNVGKSTLLNTLFDCDLAPKRNGPCTAVPVEFEHGSSMAIDVQHRDDFRPQRIACASIAEVSRQLHTLADDSGAVAARAYRKISVRLPHPLLDGMVITDTPGFGAAQSEEAEGTHEQVLVEYLRQDPSRVMWLTTAIGGLGDREITFYRKYMADLCDDIVLTKCAGEGEEWSERDSQRYEQRYGRVFGRRRPRFHFTSAMERFGIDELREYLVATAAKDSWFQEFSEQLMQLCTDLAEWFRTEGDELVTVRHRPDSMLRMAAAPECKGLRNQLIEQLNMKTGSAISGHDRLAGMRSWE